MRVLGFSKKWDKLNDTEFTTFRFPRKDKDWQIGEFVQVVYKPRSKEREILGIAQIIIKASRMFIDTRIRNISLVTEHEAILDGFNDWFDMRDWLIKTYSVERIQNEPMNKLTLRWTQRWLYMKAKVIRGGLNGQ